MNAIPFTTPDVILLEPKVFADERDFFYESFNQKSFEEATSISPTFVQGNHSQSIKGVLRGLHYQLSPKTQGKLARVVQGEVFDVAIDIRKSSPTFGQWVSEILSTENKKQLWILEGFSQGFITLSATAEFLYTTTQYYAPEYERCIAWNDPTIRIDWPPNIEPRLPTKDQQGHSLENTEVFV